MRVHIDARVAAVCCAVALACGSEPEDPGVAAPPPSPAVESKARAELDTLKRRLAGEIRVSVDGDRISLETHEARPSAILVELERAVGFERVGEPLSRARLSLELEQQPLQSVLAALLPGSEFRVEYRYDAALAAHRPTRVLIGEALLEPGSPGAGQAPAVAAAPPQESLGERLRRRRSTIPSDGFERERLSDEERERLRAEFLARDEAARAALDDEDPTVRAEAIEDVDIEGPGRDRVFALAESDPDAAVRAAALRLIFEEESPAARDALFRGLTDPDPQVVLEAIEALEGLAEESAIPHLEVVAQEHSDSRVRQRAQDVIEFLE